MGVTLSEQGLTDERGEAPVLLCDWLRAVRPVIYEARAYLQAKAQEAANQRR